MSETRQKPHLRITNNSSVGQKILNMQIISNQWWSLDCKICPESKYHGAFKRAYFLCNMNVLTKFNGSLPIRF